MRFYCLLSLVVIHETLYVNSAAPQDQAALHNSTNPNASQGADGKTEFYILER